MYATHRLTRDVQVNQVFFVGLFFLEKKTLFYTREKNDVLLGRFFISLLFTYL